MKSLKKEHSLSSTLSLYGFPWLKVKPPLKENLKKILEV